MLIPPLPRMFRVGGASFLLHDQDLVFWFLSLRSVNLSISQLPAFVADTNRAVQPFFDQDLLCPGSLFDLVELAVMSDGEVVLDRALFFDTQNAVKFPAGKCRPVQIRFGCSLFPELPLVLRQIGR